MPEPTRSLSPYAGHAPTPAAAGYTPDANAPTLSPDVVALGRATAALPPTGDRYRLVDEIARGGMGIVFRATDTVLGREVAVKVLHERFDPNAGAAARFVDEARIA